MTPAEQVLTPTVAREWSQDYQMFHRAVGVSRVHARRQLTLWSWRGDVEDAALIVSELLTNAVNHARVVDATMRLRLAVLEDGTLLIEVADPLPAFPCFSEVIRSCVEDEQGRGLRLVRAFGAEVTWFLRQHGGKTVRAHVCDLTGELP
ncbi:ATP-binding protein [Streptomyces sp. NPDC050658]|uniref:ATP-binding protein n=1 Tax=unclassified Streptomyces TaxID=2593676 RepID=UPI00344011E6